MASSYQAVCNCGFKSNICTGGMNFYERDLFVVVVYLPATATLVPLEFRNDNPAIDMENFVTWIDDNAALFIRERFGEQAVGVGVWKDDAELPSLKCPQCGENHLLFKVVAF